MAVLANCSMARLGTLIFMAMLASCEKILLLKKEMLIPQSGVL